jgi:hypothetical protein
MILLFGVSTVLAALAPPPPTSAPPPADEPIIVQGTADTRRQINHYVDQLTAAQSDDQLGRFLAPICPKALGLLPGEGELVEQRMRKVAAAVGAPLAPEKCEPNTFVLIGSDKRASIEGVRKQYPALVDGVPNATLKALETSPGPAASWQVVGLIGADGMPLASVRTSGGSDPVRIVKSFGWISRISRLTRPQFLVSVLVIETKALDGVDTRQLADYAVMRTLAPTDTTRRIGVAAPSILKLFDIGITPETAPASVTWWDFAFLKALYSTNNEVNAAQQRGDIAHQMQKELSKAPKGE